MASISSDPDLTYTGDLGMSGLESVKKTHQLVRPCGIGRLLAFCLTFSFGLVIDDNPRNKAPGSTDCGIVFCRPNRADCNVMAHRPGRGTSIG